MENCLLDRLHFWTSVISFTIHLLIQTSYVSNNTLKAATNLQNSWKQISETADECDSITPQIIFGEIPTDIKGYVYKNGAGRIKLNNNLFYSHWFDGDGMTTLLKFKGNGEIPSYTSKYIKTTRFISQGIETSYFKTRGAWTEATHWYNNILTQPTDPSNTNILHFNNKVFSICEGGEPIQIDPNTLDTINNKYTFNGQLKSFFNAHPKIYFNSQMNSNVLINIGISVTPPSTSFDLYVYAIKENNEQFIEQNIIELPYNCLVHDFLITEDYIIILISPYVMSSTNILKSILLGLDSLGNYQQWKPELGSYVYVLDKYSLNIIGSNKLESISFWHWVNGYNENNNIYTRLLRFPTDKRTELEYRMKYLFSDDSVKDVSADLFGNIIGFNINLMVDNDNKIRVRTDIVEFTELNKIFQPFELLDVNDGWAKKNSKNCRYLYGNSISENGLFLDSLQKIDLLANKSYVYSDIDKNIYLTSPLFIQSLHGMKEDDGYIICYGYSVNDKQSLIYIFDAHDIAEPLTIMRLDTQFPLFIHGVFVPIT